MQVAAASGSGNPPSSPVALTACKKVSRASIAVSLTKGSGLRWRPFYPNHSGKLWQGEPPLAREDRFGEKTDDEPPRFIVATTPAEEVAANGEVPPYGDKVRTSSKLTFLCRGTKVGQGLACPACPESGEGCLPASGRLVEGRLAERKRRRPYGRWQAPALPHRRVGRTRTAGAGRARAYVLGGGAG